MCKIEPGHRITAHGCTFTVQDILFQDYYGDRDVAGASDCWGLDVEFRDDRGRYHHWKQNQDHGYVWEKCPNGMTFIVNDDGSLQPGDTLRIHFNDPEEPASVDIGALVVYVGRDEAKNYVFRSATYGHTFLLDMHLETVTCSRNPDVHMAVDNRTGWLRHIP